MVTARSLDQQRALWAYGLVEKLAKQEKLARNDVKTLLNGFGANVQRSGLAAAMAFLERESGREVTQPFLEGLAGAPLLERLLRQRPAGKDLPGVIRGLPLRDYQLVTREVLKGAIWLRRAAQALLKDESHA